MSAPETDGRKGTLKLRFIPLGVDLIDRNGEYILGITESDAVDLHALLSKNMKKIKARIKRYDL